MTSWLAGAGIGNQYLAELAGRRPKQRDVDPATPSHGPDGVVTYPWEASGSAGDR
ncbi:hypothetical protein [Isoptericola croceus]|uniref:hypothetical protein n=1 Tax=Isoptericola croceus TaxID=3031406 RepID=UPI0023F89068|nr:hypothetical protein [Isoptericola croceus]